MSRKGNCYDNACIESLHSVLKKEVIYLLKYKTREEAKKEIYEYIKVFYNSKRIHSVNGYLSLLKYEQMPQQDHVLTEATNRKRGRE